MHGVTSISIELESRDIKFEFYLNHPHTCICVFQGLCSLQNIISRYEDNCLIVCKHSNYQGEMFKVREKRFGFQTPFIKVPADAVVSYENNTVTVLRGSVQLHKFSGISQFQVFNHTERHLTFSGNATEEIFCGFGRLLSLHHYTICKYSGFSWSIPLAMSYKHVNLKKLGV